MIRLPARAPDLNFLNQKNYFESKTFFNQPEQSISPTSRKNKNLISDQMYWSGKSKMHCIGVLAACNHRNRICYAAPTHWVGGSHDTTRMNACDVAILPCLRAGEYKMTDMGFISCARCVHPYRRLRGVVLSRSEQEWNTRINRLRWRVEVACFGHTKKWKIFKQQHPGGRAFKLIDKILYKPLKII